MNSLEEAETITGSPPCIVRRLRPADLARVIEIDAKIVGRPRRGYFEHKLAENLLDSSVEVSLGAEVDKTLVGFVLARVWCGEFGETEPVAVLDTFGVHPLFQGRGIGTALLQQLATNLRGLRVHTLRTEAGWDSFALLSFFRDQGFRPAPRVCLDLDLEGPAARSVTPAP